MNAQVTVRGRTVTIRGVDHLAVSGGLVELQRSSPTGYETVAVAGEGLLVCIEPATVSEANGPRPAAAHLPEAVGLEPAPVVEQDLAVFLVSEPLD
jgi:hypothetical protein